jgi:hypothetical protein
MEISDQGQERTVVESRCLCIRTGGERRELSHPEHSLQLLSQSVGMPLARGLFAIPCCLGRMPEWQVREWHSARRRPASQERQSRIRPHVTFALLRCDFTEDLMDSKGPGGPSDHIGIEAVRREYDVLRSNYNAVECTVLRSVKNEIRFSYSN